MRTQIGKYYDHKSDHYTFARQYRGYYAPQKSDWVDNLTMLAIGVLLWSVILWSI